MEEVVVVVMVEEVGRVATLSTPADLCCLDERAEDGRLIDRLLQNIIH